MKFCLLILLLALALTGCTSRSKARGQAQNAYLAGQNAALQKQLEQFNGITVIGAVQNAKVPWVSGLTLAQAVATAVYVGAQEPRAVIITRNGESAALDANVLLNGTEIPLELGDVVELR
ncbi:MAG: hypothetical protein RL616_107 [Verrucomicrobiota bacterium]|jgi:hypothetical protein